MPQIFYKTKNNTPEKKLTIGKIQTIFPLLSFSLSIPKGNRRHIHRHLVKNRRGIVSDTIEGPER